MIFFLFASAILALSRADLASVQDIVIHPDVLKIDGTARLLCMVSNISPSVTVLWTKVNTGNVISADGVIKADTFAEKSHVRKYDISVYKSDETTGIIVYELIIHKLQMLDGGLYRCYVHIAGYISNKNNGKTAKLTIVVPPRINLEVMKPLVTTYLAEPEVRILCQASGQPTPNITWSRFTGSDSTNIEFKDGSWIKYGETLVIEHIEETDAGLYRCAAKNNVDPDDIEMAQYDIQLQVHYRPSSTVMQREVGQAPNRNYYAQLDCRIKGFPSPEMFFYKVSPIGNTSMPKIQSEANRAAVDSIYDIEGHSLEDCTSTWKVEEGPIKQTSDMLLSHHQQPESSDSWLFRLEIKNVRISHYGYYMCSAENSLGASCGILYLYETTRCQGTICPDRLKPAQQLGSADLSVPSAALLAGLSLVAVCLALTR